MTGINGKQGTNNGEYRIKPFAAIDKTHHILCVSGENEFRAIKKQEIWHLGYPDFDDLMDFFEEIKDRDQVEKYYVEAVNAIRDNSKGQEDNIVSSD